MSNAKEIKGFKLPGFDDNLVLKIRLGTGSKFARYSSKPGPKRRGVVYLDGKLNDRPFGKGDVAGDFEWRRSHSAPIKPAVMEKAISLVLMENLGLEVTDVSYDKYAGCTMCPCSPGYVIKGSWIDMQKAAKFFDVQYLNTHMKDVIDIWVVTSDEAEKQDKINKWTALRSAQYNIDKLNRQIKEIEDQKITYLKTVEAESLKLIAEFGTADWEEWNASINQTENVGGSQG